MASVRARRSGGRAAEPARKRRKAAAPAPSYENMPRLARIKLSGGLSADDVQVTPRSLAVALTGLVLFVGIAVASAAWLGSSLFDAREAFARSADSAAASAGFEIDSLDVAALPGSPAISRARQREVLALLVPEGRRSMLSLDPDEVKARVESLDWVASARVRRLWPSTLKVEVERRQEYALWEEDGQVSVIDMNGERLLAERAVDHPNLPLIIGRGAGPAAQPILAALESLPETRARLVQMERVGNRRWNLELESGAIVALPEQDAAEALARLETLHARYRLLDRPVRQFDLRTPNQLAVRVHPALAGGLNPLVGGA